MKLRTINGVSIRAVATALPDKQITQDDFSSLYGSKEVERITKGTGIKSIRQGTSLRTSELIIAACKQLLSKNIVCSDDIDAVIVVTQTPDTWSPGVGFIIQHELGLSQESLVLDLSAGCAGYISAIIQAGALISTGAYKKILLCTGDVTTKLLDDDDRHVRMLFGDGASATLLESGEDKIEFMSGSDGSGYKALGTDIEYKPDSDKKVSALLRRLHMDGTAVMNFALSTVPATVKELLASTGLTTTTLDLLVLHQANEFMINYLRRMIGVEPSKVPIDIDGIGNTSSTSIPIVLSRNKLVGTHNAKNVILCGFGAGLSWGAIKVNLENTVAISPVYVPCEEQHDSKYNEANIV